MKRSADFFSGKLDQVQPGISQYDSLDRIFFQCSAESFQKLLFMLRIGHIDEIYDNDAGEVAQLQLNRNFFGRLQICSEKRFLQLFFSAVFSCIDINGYQCFRGLYHKITA